MFIYMYMYMYTYIMYSKTGVFVRMNVYRMWNHKAWSKTTQENNPSSTAWHAHVQEVLYSKYHLQLVYLMYTVWGTIDKLVTQGLQPLASKAFCALAREADVSLISIWFFASYKSFTESQVNVWVVYMSISSLQVNIQQNQSFCFTPCKKHCSS